jgi:hypothetical protein
MKKILFFLLLLFSLTAIGQTDTTVIGFTVSADPNFKNTIAVDVIWNIGPATSYRGTSTNKITGAYGSVKQGTVSIRFSSTGTIIVGPKKILCY